VKAKPEVLDGNERNPMVTTRDLEFVNLTDAGKIKITNSD